jgi:hypothetical protein
VPEGLPPVQGFDIDRAEFLEGLKPFSDCVNSARIRRSDLGGVFAQDEIGDANGHRLPTGYRVATTAILNGPHHEYFLEKRAA